MVEFVQTHTQHATVATAGYAALVTNPKERKFTARELEQAVEGGMQAHLRQAKLAGLVEISLDLQSIVIGIHLSKSNAYRRL